MWQVCYRAFLWGAAGEVSDVQVGVILCSFPARYRIRKWLRHADWLKLVPDLAHGFAAHFVVIAAQQDGEMGFLGQRHQLGEVGTG